MTAIVTQLTGYRMFTGQIMNQLINAVNNLTGNGTPQAITGSTVSSSSFIFTPNTPVAATGSTVTDAAQLSNGFTVVTASNGTKAVKLPAVPTPGMLCGVINSVAGQPLIIFPDTAATINAIGSHGALTCANTVPVLLYATSATQWYSIPLLPS